jgi:hypothetical protein
MWGLVALEGLRRPMTYLHTCTHIRHTHMEREREGAQQSVRVRACLIGTPYCMTCVEDAARLFTQKGGTDPRTGRGTLCRQKKRIETETDKGKRERERERERAVWVLAWHLAKSMCAPVESYHQNCRHSVTESV